MNNNITQLLKKYAEGNCSQEESALIDRWYLSEAAARPPIDPQNPLRESELIWKGLQSQLALGSYGDSQKAEQNTRSFKASKIIRFAQLKWVAAACILLITSFFAYRALTVDNHEALMAEIRKNDIAPGKSTATLTLPDGKKISLSDAKTGVVIDARGLAYSDGEGLTVESAKTDTVAATSGVSITEWTAFSKKMMNVTTPRGGTYQVVLPDGSKVWLNAASTLYFPQQFEKAARVVMLIGEAYFEIAKNPKQPFKVISIGQHVSVLGTRFNMNAYRDESGPKTTLLEGSVNVSWARDTAILRPGQQAIQVNKKMKITNANPDEVLAWKNGKFRFVDEDIKSIMRKVSRWYNVDVEYRGEITQEKFGGQVSKFSNVSDILEVLQLTGFVHFKIEQPDKKGAERRIVVLP